MIIRLIKRNQLAAHDLWWLVICFLFCVSYFFAPTRSLAQQNSPYSRYGIGEIRPSYLPVNKSMGNITSAFWSLNNINFHNPASFTSIKYTTFETGIFISSVRLQTVTEKANIENASLSHIALAFPAAKKWGMSLGLIPFSRMDYNIEENTTRTIADSTIQLSSSYAGSGSLYQLYLGNAFRIHKLSIGVNVAYLFGKLSRQTTQVFYPASAFFFNERKTNAAAYSGILFTGGIQYIDTLAKNLLFSVGINSRLSQYVNTNSETMWERIDIDTLPFNSDTTGKTMIPATYGGGILLKKVNKWMIGAQFDYSQWSKYTSFNRPDSMIVNTWSAGVGGEFIPDYKAVHNYFKMVQYRLGFYYSQNYLKLNQHQLTEYGITFGLGLPIRKTISRINIGFEIGQKGTIQDNLIKETFFKTHIGFTINDIWFIKRKFD